MHNFTIFLAYIKFLLYLCSGFRKNVMLNTLRQFGNIPVSTSVLQTVLPPRTSFTHFVSNLVDSNQLIRIKRGMYVVPSDITGKPINTMLIANTLYGPSYVSFSTALHYYGLIDDMSQNIWSATIKRTKHYSTPLGAFEYLYMPQEYYSIGITQVRAEDYSFLIATPEKALCDIIINSPRLNLRSKKDALTYLEEDLRFEMDHISSLDPGILKECAKCGIKSNSIQQIIKLVQS